MNREDKKIEEALKQDRKRYVIAVDIDGCLAKTTAWRGFNHFGRLIKSTWVRLTTERIWRDAHIIIHTCRATTREGKVYPRGIMYLKRWLKANAVPYDEIWIGCGKPFAHSYWDNCAVRMPAE